MNCFEGSGIYFPTGLEHILDIQGYDHILFVIALTVMYKTREWRRVLILITAFTIGHSITLALSVLDVLSIPSEIIEFLIPVTIFLTALLNIFRAFGKKDNVSPSARAARISYLTALVFGFVHGMGFSNYLKAILGKEACILGPLLTFNLGLEAGQIVIVILMMLLSFLVVGLMKLPHKAWKIGCSLLVGLVSIYLMKGTIFW